MKSHLTISMRIALIFTLVITLLVSGLSTALYVRFSTILETQIQDDLHQILIQNKLYLENMVNSVDQATTYFYTDKYMLDIMAKSKLEDHDINSSLSILNLQISNLPLNMNTISYTTTFFVDKFIPYSKYISETNSFYMGIFNDNLIRDEQWYIKTTEKDGELNWFLDTDKKSKKYLCFSRLIKNPLYGHPYFGNGLAQTNIGTVIIRFNISTLELQLNQSKLTPNTLMFLTDEKENILFGKDPSFIGKNASDFLFLKNSLGVSKQDIITEYAGLKYKVNSVIMQNGWRLTAFVPVSDIHQSMVQLKGIIFLTLAVSLLIGIILTIFLSKRISHPIHNLAEIMQGVKQKNNMDAIELPSSNDEVSILYQSYNSMMEQIKHLMNHVYKSGLREKDAEIKALIAQINPHFLYNTLDSINWLAMEMDAQDISSIITNLSEILRYSIKEPNTMVTLEEEVQQVKNYISIQLSCYCYSFDVFYDIPFDVLKCKTIKLILQPLVENSITHGMCNIEHRGMIKILGYFDNETLVLKIIDNGICSDINKINARLEQSTAPGVGIKNVHQRIKSCFGDEYGLIYEINEYNGVTAIIRIPKVK